MGLQFLLKNEEILHQIPQVLDVILYHFSIIFVIAICRSMETDLGLGFLFLCAF